jgi:D-glucosaminate-6-phosphate ammonia-lyase
VIQPVGQIPADGATATPTDGASVALQLRGPRVINARSYSTKVGGCLLAEDVVAAMAEAARFYVRMEDMQAAAGQVIKSATGADAGIVTGGAAAALTLAAAACIARLDPTRMNRLPDTSGIPAEIVILRRHRNPYDHALRAAGARLVDVGFDDLTHPYEIEAAISPQTRALFFLAGVRDSPISLPEMVEIGRRHGVPTIVDGSLALPPASNLRALIAVGADLVAFSGGKHIEGPQASGILCGRRDLVLSASLQQQDMDVHPETWPLRSLIADGSLPGPPHHGLGRGFKVGKEEIAGLAVALLRYAERDFEAEAARWSSAVDEIVHGLQGLPGLVARRVDPAPSGRPVPVAHLQLDAARGGLDAHGLINALQENDPIVCTYEALADQGIVVLMPETLLPDDLVPLVAAIRRIVLTAVEYGGAEMEVAGRPRASDPR